ncbi:MAG: hypothetical protein ACYTGL_11840 [Planctomycetota bacterium]|jgi:hypothetical protein
MGRFMFAITVAAATAAASLLPSAEERNATPTKDSVVIHYLDGRTLTIPVSELARVSYHTRPSALKLSPPRTIEHVLVQATRAKATEMPSTPGDWLQIDQSEIETAEWQNAIEDAKSHQGGRGQYTLLRVVIHSDDPGQRAQLDATKLKELTARYSGGGGQYRNVASGGFVLLEHINSSRRKNGADPLKVAAQNCGMATIDVPVPKYGVLGILGEIVISPAPPESRGSLEVLVRANSIKQAKFLRIGPLAVGGPYGKSITLKDGGGRLLDLPAGRYKLLMSDFDVRRSRWDVNIVPGMTTRLEFEVKSPTEVVKVLEEFAPRTTDEQPQ